MEVQITQFLQPLSVSVSLVNLAGKGILLAMSSQHSHVVSLSPLAGDFSLSSTMGMGETKNHVRNLPHPSHFNRLKIRF